MTADPHYLSCQLACYPPHVSCVTDSCKLCSAEVWVAFDLRGLAASGELIPICSGCHLALAEKHPDMRAEIHPAQEASLRGLGLLGEIRKATMQINNGKLRLSDYLDRGKRGPD